MTLVECIAKICDFCSEVSGEDVWKFIGAVTGGKWGILFGAKERVDCPVDIFG